MGSRELEPWTAEDFVGVLAPLGISILAGEIFMFATLLELLVGFGGKAAAAVPPVVSLNSDAASELRSLIDAPRLPLWLLEPAALACGELGPRWANTSVDWLSEDAAAAAADVVVVAATFLVNVVFTAAVDETVPVRPLCDSVVDPFKIFIHIRLFLNCNLLCYNTNTFIEGNINNNFFFKQNNTWLDELLFKESNNEDIKFIY